MDRTAETVTQIEEVFNVRCEDYDFSIGQAAIPTLTLILNLNAQQYWKAQRIRTKIGGARIQLLGNNRVAVQARCSNDMIPLLGYIH